MKDAAVSLAVTAIAFSALLFAAIGYYNAPKIDATEASVPPAYVQIEQDAIPGGCCVKV